MYCVRWEGERKKYGDVLGTGWGWGRHMVVAGQSTSGSLDTLAWQGLVERWRGCRQGWMGREKKRKREKKIN